MHVNIRNNRKLQVTFAMKEILLLSHLADRTSHESASFILETSPCAYDVGATLRSHPETLESCSVLKGDVTITQDLVETVNLEHLAFIEKLHGCLTIRETSLENLLFLRALKEVECKKNQPPVLIENNNLKTLDLGIHAVQSSYGRPIVIKGNSFLCREFVDRWQRVLVSWSQFKNNTVVIGIIEDGDNCGLRYSASNFPVAIGFAVSLAILVGSIMAIDARFAK